MKKPVVAIGIDPSLNNTGWAVMEDKKVTSTGVWKNKVGGDADQKMSDLFSSMLALIEEHDVDVVGIEEERVFHSTTAVIVGEVIGVIKAAVFAVKKEMSLVNVNPKRARKFLGLNGRDKGQILAQVQLLFPRCEIKTHHEADAIAVANAAYLSYSKLI